MIKRKKENCFDMLLSENQKFDLKEDSLIQTTVTNNDYKKFDRLVKEKKIKIAFFFITLFISISTSLLLQRNLQEGTIFLDDYNKQKQKELQIDLLTKQSRLDIKIKDNIRNAKLLGISKENKESLLNIKIKENERQKKILEDDLKKVNELLTKKIT